ncbi:MAG: sialate O-acetylesterase [Paludibacter sp.]|jgi:sialate O-acetylesterase
MYKKSVIFTLLCTLCMTSVQAQISLSSLFTDNMVLQQQTDAPIWGKAKAKQQIDIFSSWNQQTQTVVANEQGIWKANLATPEAGGPYEIIVSSGKKEKISLKNVLIGEVWLCSGQSNMEWRLREGLVNQQQEIAAADFPKIRMVTIKKETAFVPVDECTIVNDTWQICSPETVGEFSAVAYFFGKNLHENLNVPIGLINSSWGGTVAQAWTEGDYLLQMPYYQDNVQRIRQMPSDKQELERIYQQSMESWLQELNTKDQGIENGKLVWTDKGFDDADWFDFPVPGMAQTNGMTPKNGIFWFRKEVDIPTSWSGQEITINMGPIDDDDFTYFNGELIGQTEGWMSPRNYKIPGKLVKPGKSVIAIRVMDTGGEGGLGGDAASYWLSSSKGKIDISGNWKTKLSLDLNAIGPMPRRLDGNANEPTVLYNAMINPLVPYAFKGAIWYQGESNAGLAVQYRDLLPLMINSWRKQFGHEFPFYIVQLANFTKLQTEPVESSWAELREAQSLTAKYLNNTGIAVTIDIGEADDIHPRNKQDVGKRLALAARAQTYGEKIPYSGPVYKTYKIEGNSIRLSFEHTDGGLQTKNGEKLQGFTIAGADHKFYWADAGIEGDEIIVSSPEVKFPVAVRYAWADNPICNLYNGAGLPASPFRTDNWRGITE